MIDETAVKTTLGTWEKPVNPFDVTAIPLPLVAELSHELRPTNVRDSFGETVVLKHALHVQVFDYDDLVFVNQSPTEFVKEILPLVGYLLVLPGYFKSGFLSAIAALLCLAQLALQSFEPALRPGEVFGVGKSLSIAGYSKILQAKIDADLPPCIGWFINLLLHLDGGKISTALGFRYGQIFHFTFNRAVQDDPYQAHLGNEQLVAFYPETLRKAAGLPIMLLFELWEFSTLIKKVAVGHVQVPKRLLQDLGIGLLKPAIFGLFLKMGQGYSRSMIGEALASFGIGINTLSQKVIVGEATCAKLPGKLLLLFSGWIDSIFIGAFDIHVYKYSAVRVICQTRVEALISPP